jgi:hypothetical protein
MFRLKLAILTVALVTALGTASLCVMHYRSRPRCIWDFTNGRAASSFGIRDRSGPLGLFVHVTMHGRVVARLAPGHTLDESVVLARFEQHDKPGIVDVVEFELEPQTLEEAFRTATKLAREWELDLQPLNEWHEQARSGAYEYAQTMRNDRTPSVAVEIFKAYRADRPFRVMLQVSWLDHGAAASRPSEK